MTYGFIYCLTNHYMPGLCKIGYTDRAPSQRCKELSASTSVPDDFDIQFYVEVEGASQVERAVHFFFDDERVNSGREFFRCAPIEVYQWLTSNVDIVTEYLDGDMHFELQRLIDSKVAASSVIHAIVSSDAGF